MEIYSPIKERTKEMKEHIHLFTPVSEGLPEAGKKLLVIDYKDNVYYGKWDGIILLAFDYEINGVIAISFTHYLDLSKLTTKDKAEGLDWLAD